MLKQKKIVKVTFSTLRIYTKLYQSYKLLYCKGHIQMTSNHNTIHVKKEKYRVKNCNITFNLLKIYTTLYHTFKLLYCKDKFRLQVITAQWMQKKKTVE